MPIFPPAGIINGRRIYDQIAAPTNQSRGEIWRERDVNGDLLQEWVWDNTYWLSKELLSFTNASQGSSASTTSMAFSPRHKSYNLFFVNYEISYYILAPNDSTNYWTLSLVRQTPAGTVSQIGTVTSTALATAVTWSTQSVAVNLYLDSVATDARALRVSATKILSPGALIFAFTAFYRLARP